MSVLLCNDTVEVAQDYAYLLRAPKAKSKYTHQQLYNQSRHDMSMNNNGVHSLFTEKMDLKKKSNSVYITSVQN